MTTLHSKTNGKVKDMSTNGNLGADWLIGMQAHFGQTGEFRGADVYRLLGDQRQSFDLAGVGGAATSHKAAKKPGG